MAVFGGTALLQIANYGCPRAKDAAMELRLFVMLSELLMPQITSGIGIILVLVFFVTSLDLGSLVIDTITAAGKTYGPLPQRVFWCFILRLVAIALFLCGGLAALQTMAVTTGLPFAALLLLMCVGLWKGLRQAVDNKN